MTPANPGSDILAAMMARRSIAALTEPGPDAAQLNQIVAAGTTGPDHGSLRPYRFVVVDASSAGRFGEALAHDTDLARGGISDEVAQKFRRKAGAAPIQVLIVFSPVESTKAPRWEQRVAAGCTGYPILLAATTLGFGAAWRSAAVLDGPAIAEFCRFTDGEELLGWINIGTAVTDQVKKREPVDVAELVYRP